MKKRNGMMAAGAFAILFTGFPHVWSIYQPYVLSETGWSESMVSICFYLPTLFFVFGNIFGGRIYDKGYGRLTLGVGGGIFAGGIILSALTLGVHPMITYMTLGVMQGIGQGMIYAVILATAQKWFPHKTGFASGVVITANGLCGFILSPISKVLLGTGGARSALISVGLLVFLSAVCAVGSVMVGSILNAGIRLILPTLADKAGRIPCIQCVLFVAMLAMIFLLSGNNRLITAAIAMIFSMLLKKEINQSGKEVKSYGTCKNERSAS